MIFSTNLSIIILTYNEEIHIKRSLESALSVTKNVYIVDSYSTDKTIEIAKIYTENIFFGDFSNFSEKLNWAINNLPIETKWSMRLDADEILTDDFKNNISIELESIDTNVYGIYVRRQLWFMNKWMRYGDMYPTYSMRLWKTKEVICENRLLDEHMILKQGNSATLNLDIIDHPLTSISDWIIKHNKYSTLEMISYFKNKIDIAVAPKLFGNQEERKRWLKNKLFYKFPLFLRPLFYFTYRYVIKLGFLDGLIGLIWHVLHGFWYRFLVDVKVYEIEQKSKNTGKNIEEIIFEEYGIKL